MLHDHKDDCQIRDLCTDLENWMSNLPLKLKNIPLIQLAIPGSHDSMTATINYRSKLAPDAEPCLKRLSFLGRVLSFFVSRWARTQKLLIEEQLTCGIRYYDLRLASRKNREYPYFVHGLYAKDVLEPFKVLNKFLDEHPGEVVILDCQHFYDFDDSEHDSLIELFIRIFGSKLTPLIEKMETLTLNFMAQNGYQVILIYRYNKGCDSHPLLWPGSYFPNPWPNTDSISVLIPQLTNGLRNQRDPQKGYVSQCILTPTDWFIARYIYSTLKEQCASPLIDPMHDWLRRQKPGPDGINIVISDYVNLRDYRFSREVIVLNAKLIPFKSPIDLWIKEKSTEL